MSAYAWRIKIVLPPFSYPRAYPPPAFAARAVCRCSSAWHACSRKRI